MGLGLNASSALTVVMKCSSLKQPEDKHLASQHKPQERPINGSPYGEHSVEEEAQSEISTDHHNQWRVGSMVLKRS